MSIEKLEKVAEIPEAPIKDIEEVGPSFEKKELKKGVTIYIFDHVAVAIDVTGKNYKGVPEILWGTFKDRSRVTAEALNQPEKRIEGADMKFIAMCIAEVSRDSGVKEFWFDTYGDDKPEGKEKRRAARLRLFKRYLKLTPGKDNYGYIMKVKDTLS